MDYNEIIQAIRNYSEFVGASSKNYDTNLIYQISYNADFEDIVCDYVDAINEIKKIKNNCKRLCLIYDALGYLERQIAEALSISQSTVSKNLKWLRMFFNKKKRD